MPVFPRSLKLVAIGAVLLVGSAASTVNAEVPALELRWWINGVNVFDTTPIGTDNGNGTYSYNGSFFDVFSFATLTWSLTGDPDPQLSGNLTVENPGANSIEVILEVILPTAPALPGSTEMIGSAALGLTTDDGGGSLSSLANTPVWQGIIDNTLVGPSASLFFDPFSQTNSGFGSSGANSNFGIPVAVAGPAALNNIGIRISFDLTGADQASITSVFRVVPGPGGLLVLVMGMAVGRRRRRA